MCLYECLKRTFVAYSPLPCSAAEYSLVTPVVLYLPIICRCCGCAVQTLKVGIKGKPLIIEGELQKLVRIVDPAEYFVA